jgi:hypothetical protein
LPAFGRASANSFNSPKGSLVGRDARAPGDERSHSFANRYRQVKEGALQIESAALQIESASSQKGNASPQIAVAALQIAVASSQK